MLKIRLRRLGGKNKPYYQIVLCNSRISVRGEIIEKLGKYNPELDSPLFEINRERIDYWVKRGAKFSEKMESLLKKTDKTTTGGLNEVAG